MGAYWSAALRRLPDLHFELLGLYCGADSLLLHYQGPRGPAAEWFAFGPDGQVIQAAAHYAA